MRHLLFIDLEEIIEMPSYARKIAEGSLKIASIKLRPDTPFLWASGFYMPVYNDNRMNLYYPENRDTIVEGFCEILQEIGVYDAIAGTSTAGIPWGAMVAREVGKPFVYIRDKPKDHGMKNRIEGLDSDKDFGGAKVVLFEDLVSTGGSSVSAVQGIRDAKGDIDNTGCIFSYGLPDTLEMFEGKRPFNSKTGETLDKPCILRPLLTYETLIEVARETGYITEAQAKVLAEWNADPFRWGVRHGFPPIGRGAEL